MSANESDHDSDDGLEQLFDSSDKENMHSISGVKLDIFQEASISDEACESRESQQR